MEKKLTELLYLLLLAGTLDPFIPFIDSEDWLLERKSLSEVAVADDKAEADFQRSENKKLLLPYTYYYYYYTNTSTTATATAIIT